jgi:hypothetical protein
MARIRFTSLAVGFAILATGILVMASTHDVTTQPTAAGVTSPLDTTEHSAVEINGGTTDVNIGIPIPKTCRCSCGSPCKKDADCGLGGRCSAGITCCVSSDEGDAESPCANDTDATSTTDG